MSDRRVEHIISAARCPPSIRPQSFGLWHIERHDRIPQQSRERVFWDSLTVLRRWSLRTLHKTLPEIVMEDSRHELRKHMPIFERASGRILVTGLGLGCVVRGLLASDPVTKIDVVEIDKDIIRIIGAEFRDCPRVTIHHGDALKIKLPGRFDYGWHDLWTDGDVHLQRLHSKLFLKFARQCDWQGAWHFPGNLARRLPWNRAAA